ncbi:MAG: DUF1080 domain-containing protein [Candidatus Poribacteria bacterium]|nr:DUF1080 domain-containing protein [Candidatus Poribacteria bacterium]
MKCVSIIATLFLLTFSVWAGRFVETFDDDLADWQELNAHNAVPGSWEIIDAELEMTNPGGGARFFTTGDETWQDYSIEVNVKPLEKRGPGNIGILARVKGNRAVWCLVSDLFLNDPESKVMCISRDFNEKVHEALYIKRHRLLRLNKWSKLKLSVGGDHFTFSIDGKKITETGDPFILLHRGEELMIKTKDIASHPAGSAGFGLANYTARFDNITITGDTIPNSGGFAVKSQGKLATTWGNLKRF